MLKRKGSESSGRPKRHATMEISPTLSIPTVESLQEMTITKRPVIQIVIENASCDVAKSRAENEKYLENLFTKVRTAVEGVLSGSLKQSDICQESLYRSVTDLCRYGYESQLNDYCSEALIRNCPQLSRDITDSEQLFLKSIDLCHTWLKRVNVATRFLSYFDKYYRDFRGHPIKTEAIDLARTYLVLCPAGMYMQGLQTVLTKIRLGQLPASAEGSLMRRVAQTMKDMRLVKELIVNKEKATAMRERHFPIRRRDYALAFGHDERGRWKNEEDLDLFAYKHPDLVKMFTDSQHDIAEFGNRLHRQIQIEKEILKEFDVSPAERDLDITRLMVQIMDLVDWKVIDRLGDLLVCAKESSHNFTDRQSTAWKVIYQTCVRGKHAAQLTETFTEAIKKSGNAIVQKAINTGSDADNRNQNEDQSDNDEDNNNNNNDNNNNQLDFVGQLIELYSAAQYMTSLYEPETGPAAIFYAKSNVGGELDACIRDAFKSFINVRNSKIAERLDKVCDEILSGRKEGYPPLCDKLATLKAIASILRCVNERDLFETCYRMSFGSRLLQNKSASDDLEVSMIELLNDICDPTFISNLRTMASDMKLSKKLSTDFANLRISKDSEEQQELPPHSNNKSGIPNFSVNVLTSQQWPAYPKSTLILPKEITDLEETYDKFYAKQHEKRKLIWNRELGQCIITARYKRGNHELQVNALQACILMALEEADDEQHALSVDELKEITGVEQKALLKALDTLVCGRYKILRKASRGAPCTESDKFWVNDNFHAKNFRIRIPTKVALHRHQQHADHEAAANDGAGPHADDASRSQAVISKELIVGRRDRIRAALVRIMKHHRRLAKQELIDKTIDAISLQGAVEAADIMKEVHSLIDKEMLSSEDGGAVFLYVA